MNRIAPYQLWLGHAGDARDAREILKTGIAAVVQLAMEEPPAALPRELVCLRIPLIDGAENPPSLLLLAVGAIANLIRFQVPTLVCCGAGMSRSPALAAAAISVVDRKSPEECLQVVLRHHPSDVSPALWREVVSAVLNHGIAS